MIDHSGITVSDYPRSKSFYTQALGAIGYQLLVEVPAAVTGTTDVAGFGEAPKPDFWLSRATPEKPAHQQPVHFAFRAGSRAQVDAFYHAALAAGGRDNGAPGLRPHYHPDYYGAFVLDPDGHNIEAVCHAPL
ncbi:VOC family protein [Undibacterium griseum]|uniref:VOC family protein n=1 Tax=Undibacterium griseum TaxID=2762295 RepID=A0ABR6YKZ5_9BURK|nr:VOC family protein [Undibacterium griseum]MBC3884458.1 VOC family protein [Undibacterium griseum]